MINRMDTARQCQLSQFGYRVSHIVGKSVQIATNIPKCHFLPCSQGSHNLSQLNSQNC